MCSPVITRDGGAGITSRNFRVDEQAMFRQDAGVEVEQSLGAAAHRAVGVGDQQGIAVKRDLKAVMRVDELPDPAHFEPHWRCVEQRGRLG
jgi:hypothetical protein